MENSIPGQLAQGEFLIATRRIILHAGWTGRWGIDVDESRVYTMWYRNALTVKALTSRFPNRESRHCCGDDN